MLFVSISSRLIQMRAIARNFSAEATDRLDGSVRRKLRVLSKPIYRYESSRADVLDGAMFALVQGTDPEIVLLVEARGAKDRHVWQFALGRQNSIEMRVRYNDREIWHAPKLAPPWPNVRDPKQSYILFTRQPSAEAD